MKKPIIFIAILILCHSIVYSQTDAMNNTFKAGIGGAFLGDGDLFGPALDFEYVFRLNDFMALSPRIMFATFQRTEYEWGHQFNVRHSNTLDLCTTIMPSHRKLNWLSLSAGLSLRHLSGSFGSGWLKKNGDEKYNKFGKLEYPTYIDENAIGFTSSVDMRLLKRHHMIGGIKGSMQAFYTNQDIAWILSFYVGYF